jgi:hypothetical protein
MKMLITGTVGACLLLPIIGAGAHADPAHIPPITANLEPRFKLEARFRAIDESGYDWAGSDEVYVTIHVPAHKSQPTRKYSVMLTRAKQCTSRSIKAASFQSLA